MRHLCKWQPKRSHLVLVVCGICAKNKVQLNIVKMIDDSDYSEDENEYSERVKKECEYRVRIWDLNEVAANALRAELAGDLETAAKYNLELEELRRKKFPEYFEENNDNNEYGEDYEAEYEHVAKKQKTSNGTIKDMYEEEKLRSTKDENADFLRLSKKYSNIDSGCEPSGVVDNEDNKPCSSSLNREGGDLIEDCRQCLETNFCKKHLIISIGKKFYLSLPEREPLVDHHCCLVPLRHVASANLLDEDEWEELVKFKKALVRMFLTEMTKDVVFFETVKCLQNVPHTIINCIPICKEEGDLLPIYFKKAIDECEKEWSENKKLIDLRHKDVRNAVPKGLPYFNVSFGLQEGYAHVIEDEKLFPWNFAEQILGGILDLDHNRWRKPQVQNMEQQKKRVEDFKKIWIKYDFNE